MSITKAYAVVCTSDISKAHDWYSRLFGRSADLHPMPGLHEWHIGTGGVQLVEDKSNAGHSMLTLIASDLSATTADLRSRSIVLGTQSAGSFATFAQLRDPDGNQITFADPRPTK
jgi:predicted enzyme related to lactoylglutathione lyase